MRTRERRASIHYHRMNREISQQALALEMRVHRVTLAKLETYQIWPGEGLREKLASQLGKTEQQIFSEYDRNVPFSLRPADWKKAS